jgi:beta-lactamase regulating signal transducer with metallopeptidase domain
MFQQVLSLGTSLLTNGLIQSTVVLSLVLTVGWLLRRHNPLLRSFIYRAALVAVVGGTILAAGYGTLATRQGDARHLESSPASAAVTPPPLKLSTVKPTMQTSPNTAMEPVRSSPSTGIATGTLTQGDSGAASMPGASLTDKFAAGWAYFLQMAPALWLLGAGLLIGWLLLCHGYMALVRNSSRPLSDTQHLQLLGDACRRMQVRQPRLIASARIEAPCLTGIFRPALLLPARYGEVYNTEALQAIFSHELEHARRHDLVWSFAARLLCYVLWPQALLWLLCRAMENTNEECCDLAVVESGCSQQQYATFLVDMAEELSLHPLQRSITAGVVPAKSTLRGRIEHIVSSRWCNKPLTPYTRILAVIIVSLTTALAVINFGRRALPGETGELVMATMAAQTKRPTNATGKMPLPVTAALAATKTDRVLAIKLPSFIDRGTVTMAVGLSGRWGGSAESPHFLFEMPGSSALYQLRSPLPSDDTIARLLIYAPGYKVIALTGIKAVNLSSARPLQPTFTPLGTTPLKVRVINAKGQPLAWRQVDLRLTLRTAYFVNILNGGNFPDNLIISSQTTDFRGECTLAAPRILHDPYLTHLLSDRQNDFGPLTALIRSDGNKVFPLMVESSAFGAHRRPDQLSNDPTEVFNLPVQDTYPSLLTLRRIESGRVPDGVLRLHVPASIPHEQLVSVTERSSEYGGGYASLQQTGFDAQRGTYFTEQMTSHSRLNAALHAPGYKVVTMNFLGGDFSSSETHEVHFEKLPTTPLKLKLGNSAGKPVAGQRLSLETYLKADPLNDDGWHGGSDARFFGSDLVAARTVTDSQGEAVLQLPLESRDPYFHNHGLTSLAIVGGGADDSGMGYKLSPSEIPIKDTYTQPIIITKIYNGALSVRIEAAFLRRHHIRSGDSRRVDILLIRQGQPPLSIGNTTDRNGYWSANMPSGTYDLRVANILVRQHIVLHEREKQSIVVQ